MNFGLKITKWVSYHGLSFNIDPDLSYYKNIDACGLKDYDATSLAELGVNIKQEIFDKEYTKIFIKKLKEI